MRFDNDVDLGGDAPANNIVPFARGLEGISKMLDDRNKLIKFYFKEDVYKDFLLAEKLQDISDADNAQQTSSTTESINLDSQQVDKTQNYFKRFSNFLNPSDLPMPDLDPIIFSDDVTLEGPDEEEPKEKEEEEGEKKGWLDGLVSLFRGKKGDGTAPAGGGTTTKSAYGNTITPKSSMMPAPVGNVANNTINQNLLTPAEDRPQVESLKESGFEEGMQKNISDEFDADLGIDSKMKKALGLAMAAPLQAVAGGLMSLMAQTPVKSNEQKNDLMKSLSFISNAFGIPASSLENVPDDPAMLQTGVSNTQPTKASETGGGMSTPSQSSSGSGKQWWNPFSWFKNDDSPTPRGNRGGAIGSQILTSAPITNTANMTSGGMNATVDASSSSSSSFSPTMMASSVVNSQSTNNEVRNVEENNLGDGDTNLFQKLFGGATNLVSNVVAGADGHVHSVNISMAESPIQDKKPDLMSLTTKLETELMQRREDQTTSMTESFATAAAAATPPTSTPFVGGNSLNSGSNRAGLSEDDSPFFDVFAGTSQYA